MEQPETSDESWRRLTSLERFLLRLNQQPGEMTFRVDLHFEGRIDFERLQNACQESLSKHPLLQSHIGPDSCWTKNLSKLIVSQLCISEMPPWISRPLTPFRVEQGAGVAIHLTRSSDHKSLISFDFDHLRVDGQGAGRYARDVLKSYFGSEESADAHVIDHVQLSRRGEYEMPRGEVPLSTKEKLRNLWVTVRGSNLRFPQQFQTETSTSESFHATIFTTDEETLCIREHLRTQGYTLNDLALAASMIAISELQPEANDKTQVCVMNPVDLRTWGDRRLSACNRFGFAFIRRSKASLRDPSKTLKSVVEQMRYVRKRGVASEFIQGVALVESIPGLMTAIERTKRFIPTANFTCMSNSSPGRRLGLKQEQGIWGQGGTSLTRVSGFGPLPPHVPFSLALCDNGSVMSLNVRGRTGFTSPPQVATFGRVLAQNIYQTDSEVSCGVF